MKKPLVVNLFGGAGAGKSTTRAGVFNKLKLAGINCEEVFEWIKYKVYEGNPYAPTDQLYTFAKQRKFLREIGDQVDVIVTDSPILLSSVYDTEGDGEFYLQKFQEFNNMNFLIRRVKPYNPIGRYQTEDEAKDFDGVIEKYLKDNSIDYFSVDGNEQAKDIIANYIIMGLKWPQ
jgi:hypothetical protein